MNNPTRKYIRHWLIDEKVICVGETYTYILQDVGKRVSTRLVLIVNMRRKRTTGYKTSMRHKRKVFSYF